MQPSLVKSHHKALLSIGIPIVIGQIGMIILGFADTLMIGHHSTKELAAASFVNNIFNLIIIFSNGFSFGLTPIVGSLFGKGQTQDIGKALKNSLFANTVIAVFLTILLLALYFNIHWLGQPEELLPLMRPYFIILLISIFFVLLFNAFKQFADGILDTSISMWILLSGNILNIIGNYLLIYGKLGLPELGLTGAGISTLSSRIYMVIAFILIFLFRKQYHDYRRSFVKSNINRPDFISLNKLGWPLALQSGMETASFSLSAIMVGWIGTIALASHQIMLTIANICFMMYYGMGSAVAIRVSNFKGQNDIQNVRQTAKAGFHLMLCIAILGVTPIFLLRYHIGAWFSNDPEVTSTIAWLILPFIAYQFGDGLQINYANALRGIADVKPLMYIAFIAYFIISLPAGYFFAFTMGLGIVGVWMAFPFGLTSAGIMYYIRFRSKTRT